MRLRWDRFQILALASAVGGFALMVAGGVVTHTYSGMGCPDWPLCQGRVVPDFSDPATAIEWTHRTVAAVVGVLVVITTFFAWRDRRAERRILWTATVSFLLVVVQAVLGGAVVLSGVSNRPLVVAHLSTGAVFFAMTVATAILAFVLPSPARAGVPPAEEAPGLPAESRP
jgi:heme a synthase